MLYEDCLPEAIQTVVSQEPSVEVMHQVIDAYAKLKSGAMCEESPNDRYQ